MGAICGWINKKENLQKRQSKFKEMFDTMSYRGENNEGYFFSEHALLGGNRLVVRDVGNGNQPMYYKDYVIVYNGEIFNTEEMKKMLLEKGYEFESNCDTEVVLKGYAEYQEEILKYLEGFYAFGIYNTKKDELFLARDRFGIKPLYYCDKGNDFIFASMLKPILKSQIIKPRLDKKALGEILALGPSKRQGSRYF